MTTLRRRGTPRAWAYLAATVLLEVTATLSLKASAGFTQFWPSAVALSGYLLTVLVLARALISIPTSIAYTVWTGAGSALIVAFGAVVFGDKITLRALIGIVLVVGGVIVCNLSRPARQHLSADERSRRSDPSP